MDDRRILGGVGAELERDVALIADEFRSGFETVRRIGRGLVSPEDVTLLHLTDDPEDAVATILDSYERRCALLPFGVEGAGGSTT